MIVVDSSVWISQFRGHDTVAVAKLEAIDDVGQILVGDLVLLELLQGTRDEQQAARIERGMRRFTVAPMLDEAIAIAAARNYRRLRSDGITIRKTADLIIATFCIERGHALLHNDRDFSAFADRLGLAIA
ncbi:PIN domain nuclease [Bosea caraganae]|uniref:Ribonuclease VapC n=1 Tax=Bosea caraganae TaxID=2763117 RepID=A0A370L2Q8_9HYPH|nr:PIN domain nuclease [Bosea caraganae]RDJ22451.1 PIN domain nuclease [Bosea caraganae]RDJ30410.1 PIN domain nuclease [Bosea caraganae]